MLLCEGEWRAGVTWKFFSGIFSGDNHYVCAGAAIVFSTDLLTVLLIYNTKREQWEIPGGHIEPGESPEEGCIREVFEEGGVVLSNIIPFGFRCISDSTGAINPSTGLAYPQPSHSIYYAAISDQKPQYPLAAEECSRSEYVSIDDKRISNKDRTIILAAKKVFNTKNQD